MIERGATVDIESLLSFECDPYRARPPRKVTGEVSRPPASLPKVPSGQDNKSGTALRFIAAHIPRAAAATITSTNAIQSRRPMRSSSPA